MKNNSNDYLRITILKIKVSSESTVNNFTIKLEYDKQTQETDKIAGREIDLNKVFIKITKN
jgi:hypothetical protein